MYIHTYIHNISKASNSGDPRESSFLFQRISITIQRGNAAAVLASLRLVSDLH